MTGASAADGWALTLCVDGAPLRSIEAIKALRRVCEEELGGQVDLEVIDVQQAPALVKRLPGPLRRIVGDHSNPVRLRLGLDLGPAEASRPDADG